MALTEEEIRSVVLAERTSAMSSDALSELSDERAKAMDYYLGNMDEDMPAPEGRSSAVSMDVSDVVDTLMPPLIEIFASGDEVVRFSAEGPEDEAGAEQETDYVNHAFWNLNDGYGTLQTFIRDALLQKNGVAKVWWEEGEDTSRETYYDKTDDEFALILSDDSVELIEHTEKPNPYAVTADPEGQTGNLHDFVLRRRKPYGCAKVAAIPPEEFGVSRGALRIRDAKYAFHRTKRSVSDLIAAGFDRELVESLPGGSGAETDEQISRNTVEDDEAESTSSANKSMREVWVTEHYVRLDVDGDGIAELWKVTTAGSGDKVLDKEQVDFIPFASASPFPMSHRFWGLSVADRAMPIQRIKTALMRQVLDNAYFMNNQRVEVAEANASNHTLDDLLTNRPGGIVRTKQIGGINPLPTVPIGQHLFPVMEYMDSRREQSTGATQQGMGVDPNTLEGTTATAANLMTQAATAKVRWIARNLAETGIKDMMLLLHAVLSKHSKQPAVVKLRNKWVTVDPRNWKTRKDMTVSVGIGHGTKDAQNVFLMGLLNLQKEALANKLPIVTLTHVFNTIKRLVENNGFRDVEQFVMQPPEGGQMPPPPPDPKMMEAQMKLQAQQAEGAAKLQMMQQEGAAKLQLEREKAEAELQLAREKMAAEIQLQREEMQLKAQFGAYAPTLAPMGGGVRMGGEIG